MLPGRNALQPQRPAAPSAPPRPRPHRRRRSWASAHVAEHLASPAEVEAAGAPPQGVQGLDSTAVGLEGIQAQTVAPAPSPPLPTSPRDTGGAGGAGSGAPGSGGGPGPSLASLADAARVSAARLRRQLEPPPPGFPPGAPRPAGAARRGMPRAGRATTQHRARLAAAVGTACGLATCTHHPHHPRQPPPPPHRVQAPLATWRCSCCETRCPAWSGCGSGTAPWRACCWAGSARCWCRGRPLPPPCWWRGATSLSRPAPPSSRGPAWPATACWSGGGGGRAGLGWLPPPLLCWAGGRGLPHIAPHHTPALCPRPARSDGEVWRRQRRLANPAFRRAAVERYAEVRTACQAASGSPAPPVPCPLPGPWAGTWQLARHCSSGRVGRLVGPARLPVAHLPAAPPHPTRRPPPLGRAAQAMLASTTRMLRASWRDGFCRDLYADFNSLTLAITLEALFGARMAAGEDAAGRGITGGRGGVCRAGCLLGLAPRWRWCGA